MMLHPIIPFLASPIIFNITAAHTSRDSPLRYVVLAFLAMNAHFFPRMLVAFADPTGWMGKIPAGGQFWHVVSFFDRLVLRRWDYEHYGPTKVDNGSRSRHPEGNKAVTKYQGTRKKFASEATGASRGIGLFWQVNNVPEFSPNRPNYVPSRTLFIITNLVSVIACYNMHNYAFRIVLDLDANHLANTKIPLLTRLNEVTAAELSDRIIAVLGFWIAQFSLMQFFCSAVYFLTALSNPDDIKLCRPLFGRPSDGYSIRNFWGRVWHQNLRSGLEGVANFISYGVFQLPRRGFVQRYSRIFFSFLVSGVMHAFSDTGGDIPLRESGAVQFFCMQALGIVLEDLAQMAYKSSLDNDPVGKAPVLIRVLGYAWTLFFIVWTSPVWIFPALRKMRLEDALLGFDAVKPVIFGRKA